MDLAEAIAKIQLAESEIAQRYPEGLSVPTKDYNSHPLFSVPTGVVAHAGFPDRTPRVPLGMFFSESNACLNGYSIDVATMELIQETDSRQGFIERKSLCTLPFSRSDILLGSVTHNQSLADHAQFLLLPGSGAEYSVIDVEDDGNVVVETHVVSDPAAADAKQMLWTGTFVVALCKDRRVRSWTKSDSPSDVSCAVGEFDAIGYVETMPNFVLAACGARTTLAMINLATGEICSEVSYAPNQFQLFDANQHCCDEQMQEPVLRVWGWAEFGADDSNGLSWVVVTKTMWHQYSINCKQLLHHNYSHTSPVAATVSDDHAALIMYRVDEGLFVVDSFGLKRWALQQPDTKVPDFRHGECRISTWRDNAVSILLPSGWMQTYYVRGSETPARFGACIQEP